MLSKVAAIFWLPIASIWELRQTSHFMISMPLISTALDYHTVDSQMCCLFKTHADAKVLVNPYMVGSPHTWCGAHVHGAEPWLPQTDHACGLPTMYGFPIIAQASNMRCVCFCVSVFLCFCNFAMSFNDAKESEAPSTVLQGTFRRSVNTHDHEGACLLTVGICAIFNWILQDNFSTIRINNAVYRIIWF